MHFSRNVCILPKFWNMLAHSYSEYPTVTILMSIEFINCFLITTYFCFSHDDQYRTIFFIYYDSFIHVSLKLGKILNCIISIQWKNKWLIHTIVQWLPKELYWAKIASSQIPHISWFYSQRILEMMKLQLMQL